MIRIIDAHVPDKPTSRERARTDEVIDAQKRYVERAAEKFGWKIEKPRAARGQKP